MTNPKEKARLWSQEWRAKHPERARELRRQSYERRKNDPSNIAKRRSKVYPKTPLGEAAKERRNKYLKNWRARNPGYMKSWQIKNQEHRANYFRKVYQTSPEDKIARTFRVRLRTALKDNSKTAKSFSLLGCSWKNLRIYLESRFEPGMSWENYGKVWHVDHIMPCALFDLSNPKHLKSCFHFSNLQPMFAQENLSKGKKFRLVAT